MLNIFVKKSNKILWIKNLYVKQKVVLIIPVFRWCVCCSKASVAGGFCHFKDFFHDA